MIIVEQSKEEIILKIDYFGEGISPLMVGIIWLLSFWNIAKMPTQAGGNLYYLFITLLWGMGYLLIIVGIYLVTLRKTIIFSKYYKKLYFINKSIIGLRIKEYKLDQITRLRRYRYAQKGLYYCNLYLEILHQSKTKIIYLDKSWDVNLLVEQGKIIANFLGVEFLWYNPPLIR